MMAPTRFGQSGGLTWPQPGYGHPKVSFSFPSFVRRLGSEGPSPVPFTSDCLRGGIFRYISSLVLLIFWILGI